MKIVNRTPSTLEIALSGPIGETTPLFKVPIDGLKEIFLNLDEVTFINSVGIKEWIIWTGKIPSTCKVHLRNCPFVFGNQASTVVGFVTPHIFIESLKIPYNCPSCGAEKFYLATQGKDFTYGSTDSDGSLNCPETLPCTKCGKDMEQDFIPQKTFQFLKIG